MSLLAIAAVWSFSPASISAPLANHLWQSTLFAGAAALLTLLLKKNRAGARYWLWLAASMKFLIPFSLLVSLGSHLGWSRATANAQARLLVAMEEMSQAFGPVSPIPAVAPAPATLLKQATRFLPSLLFGVWLCGGVAVLFLWWLRRRRIHAALGQGQALESARELELLRRIKRSMGVARQIKLIVSKSTLEPGVVGILRPVLLLPEGISERLTDAQLEAVLSHELCHVRRRDNLAAVLHMLVEVLFWFHPLVWWIGVRLLVERERACDEEVLRLGSDPQVYAEGILKVCEFYLESPLACVAGVTGSNLKKRIEAIMTHRRSLNLDLGRKLLLAAMAATAVAGPIVFGLLQATPSHGQSQPKPQNATSGTSSFEAPFIEPNTTDTPMAGFSIKGKPFSAMLFKPDRFMATNVTLHGLIQAAYGVQDSQIVGGPDWLNAEKYDVEAKIESSVIDGLKKLTQEEAGLERGRMLQALLVDRFKLALHRETRALPSYVLSIAEGGSKLQTAKPGDAYANGVPGPGGHPAGQGFFETENGKLSNQGLPILALVNDLSGRLGRTVVDKTGLTANYDFVLHWTPDPDHNADRDASSIVTALRDQLGLKLELQKMATEVLVIDHAEKITGKELSKRSVNHERPLTCVFASVEYPEGTVIKDGEGPEQLCARVLVRTEGNKASLPQFTTEWIHTNEAIRERSKNIVRISEPSPPTPAVCTPKSPTQSNLCFCEEAGPYSQNSIVNSSEGKLSCQQGKWVSAAVSAGQKK